MADFAPLLIVVFVMLLLRLLLRPDSDRIGDIVPVRTLKYGWRFRTFILIFSGGMPVLSVVSYVNGNLADVGELVSMILLDLLALYAFLEVFLVSITFDEHGLTARSPWRKTRRIEWFEVTEYDFSGWNQWHLLRTEKKGTVRISIYLTGMITFFEELDRRTTVKLAV